MTLIKCPSRWNENAIFSFLRKIETEKDSQELIFDFRDIDFVEPFGTIMMAESLNQLSAYRKEHGLSHVKGYRPNDPDSSLAHSYLKFFGFFEHIGWPYSRRYSGRSKQGRYISIQTIDKDELSAHGTNLRRLQEVIEWKSDQLAEVLFPDDISAQIMVGYCFREIIRNVFEHAETDKCHIMAQRWPQKNEAEITVLDGGIGIYHSLNPVLGINNAAKVLKEAVRPGVSSKFDESDDIWGNSGYGLFILSELGQEVGEFLLVSSGQFIKIRKDPGPETFWGTGDKQEKFGMVSFFHGTGIKLRINLWHAIDFPNFLKRVEEKGKRIAVHSRNPSASTMLTSAGKDHDSMNSAKKISQKRTDEVLQIIRENGTMRPKDLKAYGIPSYYLNRLYHRGLLEKVGHGQYKLPDKK